MNLTIRASERGGVDVRSHDGEVIIEIWGTDGVGARLTPDEAFTLAVGINAAALAAGKGVVK